jgi:hypothetical protein
MQKKLKVMNAFDSLEVREGNVDSVSNKIDLMMPANMKELKENKNNNNESYVNGNDIAKNGAEIMQDIEMEENI